ncbi:MAG: hypothetical protein Q9198_010083, partial [Flavoplaca austrocitrina]
MPFPILNLALELRNMIYRDVMLSQEDENEMKTGFRWYELAYAPDVLEAKKARRKDAANFLLTCRQSHTPPLDLLPLIRNLDISVAEPYSRRPNGILNLETALKCDDISDKDLGVLCSDLVAYAHQLRNLVIYIP